MKTEKTSLFLKDFFKPTWSKFFLVLLFFTTILAIYYNFLSLNSVLYMEASGRCSSYLDMHKDDCLFSGSVNCSFVEEHAREMYDHHIAVLESLDGYFREQSPAILFLTLGTEFLYPYSPGGINPTGLAMLIVYWYIISCLIVFVYRTIRKRSASPY